MTDRPKSPAGIPGELSTVDALAQLSFLVQGALERRAGEYGISIIQTRLLGVLRDRRPTMNELTRLLGLDKSSVTGLVDRAERRGLVQRAGSPTDRRAVLVDLTDAGRSLVATVAGRFSEDVQALLPVLKAAESATLTTLISRMVVAHASDHGIDLFAVGAGS